MANHHPITCNDVDRPVPSPSKMVKRLAQDMVLQQQHQQSQQQRQQRQQPQQQLQRSPRINPDTNNLSMDLSRLPQSSNKPVVKSCERVHLGNTLPMHFRVGSSSIILFLIYTTTGVFPFEISHQSE